MVVVVAVVDERGERGLLLCAPFGLPAHRAFLVVVMRVEKLFLRPEPRTLAAVVVLRQREGEPRRVRGQVGEVAADGRDDVTALRLPPTQPQLTDYLSQ